MGEEVVGLEIFVHFDELQFAARLFACTAGARLAVADHAAPAGDPIGFGEWAESEDDTGGVAAGIGNQTRFSDFGGIALRQTVDGFAKPVGVGRWQLVPGFKGLGVAEAEGAAEIDDANARFDQRRSDVGGGFVRRGEKCSARAALLDGVHRQGTERTFAEPAELWKQFRETLRAVGFANVENRIANFGMTQEQARQFKAGVTSDTYDSDLLRMGHSLSVRAIQSAFAGIRGTCGPA